MQHRIFFFVKAAINSSTDHKITVGEDESQSGSVHGGRGKATKGRNRVVVQENAEGKTKKKNIATVSKDVVRMQQCLKVHGDPEGEIDHACFLALQRLISGEGKKGQTLLQKKKKCNSTS